MPKTDVYVHYGDKPSFSLVDKPGIGRNPLKPAGLWITDYSDESWLSWCSTHDWYCHKHIHEIELKADANILSISDKHQFRKLVADYGQTYAKAFGRKVRPGSLLNIHLDLIAWEPVIEKYDGILIFPHFLEFHLEYTWYNMWDCASGCLFRPTKCIAKMTYKGMVEDR